ncbi:uncharacterized protein LOC132742779 isoform X2 [Ruditapes philippinarum]|nr:uncharacterized protein LOC132742779 isoform X2 [Ruditapes philippinarum]
MWRLLAASQEFLCTLGLVMLTLNNVCSSEKTLNDQEIFIAENDDVKGLAVSQTGNVLVATGNAIYQYRHNSISFDDLVSEIDIVEDISIFTLFDYQGGEYLIRCNDTACFVHNASNIQQLWLTQPLDNPAAFGHSLGGDFSAHVVFMPCKGRYCNLYSAISGSRGTETFSERTFQLKDNVFHFDHGQHNRSRYIKSKRGTRFEFIYAFYSNSSAYFLRNTLSEDGKKIAYISQMCRNDRYFRSYMESKLECNGYTTLIAAQFVKTGQTAFLIASFSGTQSKYSGSIMCKFPIGLVEKYFIDEQEACFRGRNGTFPSWINGSESSCTESLPNKLIICGYTDKNRRILFDGSLMNENNKDSFRLSIHEEEITSFLMLPFEHSFLGYIGTDTGFLEKVLFYPSFGKSITVFRSPVSKDHGRIRSLTLSEEKNNLFFIEEQKTKSHLYMIKTNECGVHINCYSCLTDVLSCVWLQRTAMCVSRDNKTETLAFEHYCPPVVDGVSPLKGPTEGGTVLTLTGLMDNPASYDSPNQETRLHVSVMVGEIPCNVSNVAQFPKRLECTISNTSSEGSLNISLEMKNNGTNGDMFQLKKSRGLVLYKQNFVFVDPMLYHDGITDHSVKLSGNIQLTIRGENFDIGSNRRLLIGDKECRITNLDQISKNEVSCCAPSFNTNGNYTVVYEVDNVRVYGPNITYTPEPEIIDIRPSSSIVSGGVTLTLTGKYLEGFGSKCKLNLENNNSTSMNESYCKISYENDTALMLCKSTALDSWNSLPYIAVPSLNNTYGKVITIRTHPISIVEDPFMYQTDKILSFPVGTNLTKLDFQVCVYCDLLNVLHVYMSIFSI